MAKSILLILSLELLMVATACKSDIVEVLNDEFVAASVIGKGLDCKAYLIKFQEDISKITGDTSRIYYANLLPEAYQVEGMDIFVKFRLPKDEEISACDTFGPYYPQIIVEAVKN